MTKGRRTNNTSATAAATDGSQPPSHPFDNMDITGDEINRLTGAFRDPTFKSMFADYIDEITDPANRRQYELEMTQLERERGIDITFIHPVGGYVLKTAAGGRLKTFINVAHSDRIDRPRSERARGGGGAAGPPTSGLNWSLPYAQSPARRDYDQQRQVCQVFDVIFHPDTLHLAQRDARFKELVSRTALEAVRDAFGVELDMVNVKSPRMAFKGTPRPLCVRKRRADGGVVSKEEADKGPSPLDAIYPPLMEQPARLASKRQNAVGVGAAEQRKPEPAKSTKELAFTTPRHQLVHRRYVDYADMTYELDAKMAATVPHELQLTVELPLLKTAAEAQLDVTATEVYVCSERPGARYRLRVRLPYEVCEERGEAQFDAQRRRLVVRLPVVGWRATVADVCGARAEEVVAMAVEEAGGEMVMEMEEETEVEKPKLKNTLQHSTSETDSESSASSDVAADATHYTLPPYSCARDPDSGDLFIQLAVSNVDRNVPVSVDRPDASSARIRFQTIGAGYYAQPYAFHLRLPAAVRLISVDTDIWEAEIVVRVEVHVDGRQMSSAAAAAGDSDFYEAGLDESSLQRFPCDWWRQSAGGDSVFDDARSFGVDQLKAALPNAQVRSPQKQRSYSESNCEDYHGDVDDHDEDDHHDDDDDHHHDHHDEDSADDCVATAPQRGHAPSLATTNKSRTFSECSADSSGHGGSTKCLKGILKRRSSSVLSDVSATSAVDVPAACIPEEDGVAFSALSQHSKKSVRFDSNLRNVLLFKLNSTVAGQRKPKPAKRHKKKKRCADRRYSEGEASDYDAKPEEGKKKAGNGGGGAAGQQKKSEAKAANPLHDSGVDLNESSSGKETTLTETPRCDLEFKSGMIFELDM